MKKLVLCFVIFVFSIGAWRALAQTTGMGMEMQQTMGTGAGTSCANCIVDEDGNYVLDEDGLQILGIP